MVAKNASSKPRHTPDASLPFAIRLLQEMVVPTFALDSERRVILWNKACERLTGVSAAEVLGTTEHWRAFYDEPRHCLADIIVLSQTVELSDLYTNQIKTDETELGLRTENWCVMPRAGHNCYLALNANPVFDDEGMLIAVVETLRDITQQKEAQIALQRIATKDGLTGIANRRSFDDALIAEWQRGQRDQASLALLLIDVDYFKRYNDTYGHQKGDDCLKKLASAMHEKIFRPADLVARFGGEEFAILMPNTDIGGARMVAERIRQHIYGLSITHESSMIDKLVSVSIGVAAVVPTPSRAAEQLLTAADRALCVAKDAGRNRIACDENLLVAL